MYFYLELSLHPPSQHYKLELPHSILWNICYLKVCSGNKSRIIQYAEILRITIRQKSPNDTRVHFTQELHTLKFTIRLRVCWDIFQLTKQIFACFL